MHEDCGKIKAQTRKFTWFRFYTEALDDPKVQRLPPHLFKTWVNLLCLAGQLGGELPSVDDIAFRLRMSAHDAASHVDDLILAGLLDIGAAGERVPHNWEGRQALSDRCDPTAAERAKRYRERTKERDERDASRDVTALEEIREEKKERKVSDAAQEPKPRPKGTRLPADWRLPKAWGEWTQVNFVKATPDQIRSEADAFRDFWIAKPGAAATKLDWQATWRNWCRNSKTLTGVQARKGANSFNPNVEFRLDPATPRNLKPRLEAVL